jgi:hypothetical protein
MCRPPASWMGPRVSARAARANEQGLFGTGPSTDSRLKPALQRSTSALLGCPPLPKRRWGARSTGRRGSTLSSSPWCCYLPPTQPRPF